VRGWFQRHAAGLAVLLLAVAVAAPGAGIQLWDGLPLDSLPELLAFVVLVPLVFSRALRGRLVELGTRLHPQAVRIVALAAGAVIVLKLVLLVGGQEDGFRACYRSPAGAPPAGACERSYSNLLDLHGGATRIDREIAFKGKQGGPPATLSASNWNLSFVNDLRFDPPTKPSNPTPRDRLPLAVRWSGDVETARGATLVISYVGEGQVRLGGVTRKLPATYLGPQQVSLRLPGGRQRLSLSYSYRPLISIGPYATIEASTTRAPGAGSGAPLHAAAAPIAWRVVAFLDDAALVALLLLVAVGQVRALGSRDALFLLAVAAASWLVLVDYSPWREAVFVAALGVVLLLFRPNRPVVVSWYALVLVCSLHVLLSASSLGEVAYKSSGTDWLAFESQARAILDGSLRAGESVFSYPPGWRYLLFLERALFGDGDVLRSIFAFVTVSLPLVAVGFMVRPSRVSPPLMAATAALVGASLLVVSSPDVRTLLVAGASEGVTWALIPLVAAIPIFAPRSRWPWVVGPAALALTVAITPTQLLAALVLIVAMGYAVRPEQRRSFVLGVALALAVTFLPSLHDTIYGGRFLEFGLTSGTTPGAMQIQPEDLLQVLWDGNVQSKLWTHIQQILYVGGPSAPYSTTLALLLPALLLSWIAALVYSLRRRHSVPRGRLIALAAPAAYLLPHLLYQVDDQFPRHLVAGYLAMAAVTIGTIGTADSLARVTAAKAPSRRLRTVPWRIPRVGRTLTR
jgi:hypothetical protein